jgi:hypothetical protein
MEVQERLTMHNEQSIREVILAVWSDVDGFRRNVPLGGANC